MPTTKNRALTTNRTMSPTQSIIALAHPETNDSPNGTSAASQASADTPSAKDNAPSAEAIVAVSEAFVPESEADAPPDFGGATLAKAAGNQENGGATSARAERTS